MIVGAEDHFGSAAFTGAVYAYDVSTGVELYKYIGSDENEENRLGGELALSNNIAIAGATFNNNANGIWAGAVFVFDVTTGTELMKLISMDGHDEQNFGSAVAIDGSTAVIGALGDDHAEVFSGAAYLFDLQSSEQLLRLTAHDAHPFHYFGSAADIEGNYTVIGAWADVDQGENAGAAYVYDTNTGLELHKLTPPTTGSWQRFGSGGTIAIEGDIVLIGAPGKGKGEVYAYDLPTGQYLGEIKTNHVGGPIPNFGSAIDIVGNTVLISASFDTANGFASGSAFIFDLNTGQELAKFTPADGEEDDHFGQAVALDGNNAAIGASFENNEHGFDAGAAYLFDIAPQCATLVISPEPLIAGQDGTFTVTEANPSEITYLAYSLKGLGSTFVPTLNITLDLKQPQQAGNTQLTDATGFVEWVLPIPGAASGRNLWFQAAQFELKSNVVATSAQ